MKALMILCGILLLAGIADMPIGYYTLLRIVVTIGSVTVVVAEMEKGITLWVLAFGLLAILFNPIIPVYLNDKQVWMPLDLVGGVLFFVKAFGRSTKEY
jgi:hypothetical protein